MFARRIRVEYEADGQRLPCPLKWLDSFSMRNFTNATVFDDTLPVADGCMEVGTAVPAEVLNPRNAWRDKPAYDKAAQELRNRFAKNFENFDAPPEVKAAGPKAQI